LEVALAGYAEDKKGLRVDDLPAPIPLALEKVREVGNEVGKGISKATGVAAEGVNKAIKGNSDKEPVPAGSGWAGENRKEAVSAGSGRVGEPGKEPVSAGSGRVGEIVIEAPGWSG
jgi:hypothetical protein